MNMNELTQAILKELLQYSPKTGLFIRRIASGGQKVGNVAGTLGKNGYIYISVGNVQYLASRLAFLYMNGEWPADQACHDNQNPQDNRWKNLYNGTIQVNQRNQKLSSRNKSGQTGVIWSKQKAAWKAYIVVDRCQKFLGYFSAFKNAVAARKTAEKKYGFHPNHGSRLQEMLK